MNASPSVLDTLLFGAVPYVAVAVFLVVSILRYRRSASSVTSASSQFLESKQLFWGSVPFHLGILFLFVAHLVAFLFPRSLLAWNGAPVRLLILEVAGLVAGLLVLFGLVLLTWRRVASARLRRVTSPLDHVLSALLLVEVLSGVWIAVELRWGSSWFAEVLTPYLRSVLALSPDVAVMAAMPWAVKLHVAGAWVLVGLLAFTRLMHILVAPIPYLWRRPQLVLWNRARRKGARA